MVMSTPSASRRADHSGRHAGDGAVGGHGAEHDAARADPAHAADLDVAEHLRAGPEQGAVPDLGMAIAAVLAGGAQGHALEDGHAFLDDGGLADDDARPVVEHHAGADRHRRVDVDPEGGRGLAGQPMGNVLSSPLPQAVRDPMGLQGVESLEVQQRVQAGAAGGVARHDGPQVGLEEFQDGRILAQRVEDERLQERDRRSVTRRQPAREHGADDPGRGGVESRFVDRLAQHRLAGSHLDRLGFDLRPKTRAAERCGRHCRLVGPRQGPIRGASTPSIADRSKGEVRVVVLFSGTAAADPHRSHLMSPRLQGRARQGGLAADVDPWARRPAAMPPR